MISVTIFLKAAPPRLTGRYAVLLTAGASSARRVCGGAERSSASSAHAVLRVFARRRRTGGACVPSCTLHANVACLARRVVYVVYLRCAQPRCVRLCPRTSARYAMVRVAAIRRTATEPVSITNKSQDYY